MGNEVQWVGEDGGWKTGERVMLRTFPGTTTLYPVVRSTLRGTFVLIKHSHTGKLEFVDEMQLEARPMRSEMGADAEPAAAYD